MKLDGVHHIGVNVLDIDRAEKFYTDALGFRMEKRYKEEIRHLMLDTGGTTLHLFESPDLNMENAIDCLSEKATPILLLVQVEKIFLKLLMN